jgi:hypothetical protein
MILFQNFFSTTLSADFLKHETLVPVFLHLKSSYMSLIFEWTISSVPFFKLVHAHLARISLFRMHSLRMDTYAATF